MYETTSILKTTKTSLIKSTVGQNRLTGLANCMCIELILTWLLINGKFSQMKKKYLFYN